MYTADELIDELGMSKIDKLINERMEEYIIPLETARRELEWIKHLKIKGKPFELRDYEQDFLINLYTHKQICIRKARQSGLTTFYAAHITHEIIHSLFLGDVPIYDASLKGVPKFLVVCSSMGAAREFESKVIEFLVQDPRVKKINNIPFLRKILTCISASGNLENYFCGTTYKEIGFDECEWSELFKEVGFDISRYKSILCNYILPCHSGKVVCFSSPNPNLNIDFLKKQMFYDEIHWYQVPAFNRNLKWVKVVEEETIDNEGNINYNKEHFDKMLKQGYEPTSPEIEKMLECGIKKEELF